MIEIESATARIEGRGWRLVAWATGVLLLAALVIVVARLGEERELARLLSRAKPAWLLAAALLQVVTYVCAASVWQRALARQGERRPLRSLLPLGLAKLFTDQAVPSGGVSGTLLVMYALGRRGVARALAVTAVLAGLVAFYLAYAIAVLAALAILWVFGDLNRIVLTLATVFCLLATAVPLAIVHLHGRSGAPIPGWLERLPGVERIRRALAHAPLRALRSPGLLAETTALQLAIFVLDAGTLGALLLAMGTPAPPAAVFASFVLASVFATLAVVPGGIGTFEGACVTMLHLLGTPLAAALASTLLFRGFTFWLPMAPGLWLARREMGRRGRRVLQPRVRR